MDNNNELKLKELLYNIINNHEVFDYNGIQQIKIYHNVYDNIEYVKTYPYEIKKSSYEYSFFGIFCKSVVKEYYNTYLYGKFNILFPDGQPKLSFYSIWNHKEEKINLPWYKKIIGIDCIKYIHNIDYYLSFGNITTELTYVEVDNIFKLLNLKKIEFDNLLVEKIQLEQVLKLNERFEKYK